MDRYVQQRRWPVVRLAGAMIFLLLLISTSARADGWRLDNHGPSRCAQAPGQALDARGIQSVEVLVSAVNLGENYLRPWILVRAREDAGVFDALTAGPDAARFVLAQGELIPVDCHGSPTDGGVFYRFYPRGLAAADRLHAVLAQNTDITLVLPRLGRVVVKTENYVEIHQALFQEYGCEALGSLGWEYEPDALWSPEEAAIHQARESRLSGNLDPSSASTFP